jgi:hypothetical protein
MIAISTAKKASSRRAPRRSMNKNMNASTAVMTTPAVWMCQHTVPNTALQGCRGPVDQVFEPEQLGMWVGPHGHSQTVEHLPTAGCGPARAN